MKSMHLLSYADMLRIPVMLMVYLLVDLVKELSRPKEEKEEKHASDAVQDGDKTDGT